MFLVDCGSDTLSVDLLYDMCTSVLKNKTIHQYEDEVIYIPSEYRRLSHSMNSG